MFDEKSLQKFSLQSWFAFFYLTFFFSKTILSFFLLSSQIIFNITWINH